MQHSFKYMNILISIYQTDKASQNGGSQSIKFNKICDAWEQSRALVNFVYLGIIYYLDLISYSGYSEIRTAIPGCVLSSLVSDILFLLI